MWQTGTKSEQLINIIIRGAVVEMITDVMAKLVLTRHSG